MVWFYLRFNVKSDHLVVLRVFQIFVSQYFFSYENFNGHRGSFQSVKPWLASFICLVKLRVKDTIQAYFLLMFYVVLDYALSRLFYLFKIYTC